MISWGTGPGSLLFGFVGLVVTEQCQEGRYRLESSQLFAPYMIALGMGLHNLGEGLTIGASHAQHKWVLSGLLVCGFALHDRTEGSGISGATGRSKPGIKDTFLM